MNLYFDRFFFSQQQKQLLWYNVHCSKTFVFCAINLIHVYVLFDLYKILQQGFKRGYGPSLFRIRGQKQAFKYISLVSMILFHNIQYHKGQTEIDFGVKT